MKVVIAGELPLVEDLFRLCIEAGHDTTLYLVESVTEMHTARRLAEEAAAADVAVECHNESKAAKRQLVKMAVCRKSSAKIAIGPVPCWRAAYRPGDWGRRSGGGSLSVKRCRDTRR